MAKRIQMRKNRFLAIQKIAEQKKLNVDGGPDDHAPKQTVSSRLVGKHVFLTKIKIYFEITFLYQIITLMKFNNFNIVFLFLNNLQFPGESIRKIDA